jgi:hypothetical protein
MHAQTPEQFGVLFRSMQVAIPAMMVALVWFVRFYPRAGRLWLAYAFSILRGGLKRQLGFFKFGNHCALVTSPCHCSPRP